MDHHAPHLGPTSVTAGAAQAPPHRLRTLVERHPLPAFVVLVLAFGWPIMSVPALAQLGRATDSPLPTEPFALATTLLVLLPAALGITAISEGRAAARHLLRRALRWRFGAGWWAVVLGGLPSLALVAHLLVGARPALSEAPSFAMRAAGASVLAVAVLHAVINHVNATSPALGLAAAATLAGLVALVLHRRTRGADAG